MFRNEIRHEPDGDVRFGLRIEAWQERDFAALDPAWLALADRPRAHGHRRRAWIERPRGHSKTFDIALQIAWALLLGRKDLSGVVAAADRDQANLVWEAIRRLRDANPGICRRLKFRKHVVENDRRGSRLEIISADVASSWGLLPDFVICDELCHWERPDLFHSLLSSAAKKPDCLLAVLTNAGIGRGWQWEAREYARTHPGEWHFSSLRGCHATWIAAETIEEQRRLLPPAVFARLWLNEWQHSDGEFVALAEAEACRAPSLSERSRGRPGVRYVAAIDYAEKHDFTAALVAHRDGERVIVDRLDVVAPAADRPVPVAWVEAWIERIARDFPSVRFIVDPYQLVGVIQRLEGRHDIRRFEFQGGKGNHRLALALRQSIVARQVAWYPGCGAVSSPSGRDDLETELASLLLRQSASGHCRIDHLPHLHDDRAFVLGAACLHLLEEQHGDDLLIITPPRAEGTLAW